MNMLKNPADTSIREIYKTLNKRVKIEQINQNCKNKKLSN